MISVIVPSYNRTFTLKEALESICTQTYKNFEIIVVNDCGIDTKFIIDEIKKKYPQTDIKYIRHTKNKGLAATRNTGIKNSKGEFISFLDDDDIFYPEHLETLIKALKENHKYKIAYSCAKVKEYKLIDNELKFIKNHKPYCYSFTKERLLVENFIPVNAFLIRKNVFEEGFYFDEKLRYLEDYDLWLRISQKYEFLFIKKTTCEVRSLDESISKQRIPMIETQLKLYEKYPVDKNKFSETFIKRKKAEDEFKGLLWILNNIKKGERLKKVSIIVPSFNNFKFIKSVLRIIMKTTFYYNKEIIVINSNTTEGFQEKIKNFLKRNLNLLDIIKILLLEENVSTSKLINIGAKNAKGDFLAILIQSIPNYYWLTSNFLLYHNSNNCGLIGGKTLTQKEIFFNRKNEKYIKIFNIKDKFNLSKNKIEKLDKIYTYNLFIGKKDYIKIDGFNENLDETVAIFDFTSKINEIGKNIYYNPFSEVIF